MRIAAPLTLAAAALLAGCQFNAVISQGNAALDAEAIANYRDLVEGRNEAVLGRMSAANNPAQVQAQLPMLKTMAGDCLSASPAVTGTRSMVSNTGMTYGVTHVYTCPDRTVQVTSTFIKEGSSWKLQGFNVNANMAAPPTEGPTAQPSAPTRQATEGTAT